MQCTTCTPCQTTRAPPWEVTTQPTVATPTRESGTRLMTPGRSQHTLPLYWMNKWKQWSLDFKHVQVKVKRSQNRNNCYLWLNLFKSKTLPTKDNCKMWLTSSTTASGGIAIFTTVVFPFKTHLALLPQDLCKYLLSVTEKKFRCTN